MKHPLIISLLALILFTLGAAIVQADEPEPVCDHSITLQQATHIGNEPGFDLVRLDYSIKAGKKDVSYATVGVGSCYEIVECGPTPCEIGTDPKTGIAGVKWEKPVPAGTSAVYWFVTKIADGSYQQDVVAAAIKSSTSICYYSVDGAVCSATSVVLTNVSTEEDWSIGVVLLWALIGAVAGIIFGSFVYRITR